MVKLYLVRGPIIAAIALVVLVLGATLFDNSYQNVESLLKTKYDIAQSKIILAGQSVNYTLSNDQLKEHSVIVIHVRPTTQLVKFEVIEPNGMTFEKESKDGFLYHIIQKNNQDENYPIKISNIGSETVQIDAMVSEDPFLSGHCDASFGIGCSMVNLAIGLVISGIIGFIVGILIGISDLKKEKKLQK
ncbi:MAG: hypothetical protein ABI340_08690 [Nitrososphaera sp.]|jgi:hypothetical protein